MSEETTFYDRLEKIVEYGKTLDMEISIHDLTTKMEVGLIEEGEKDSAVAEIYVYDLSEDVLIKDELEKTLDELEEEVIRELELKEVA